MRATTLFAVSLALAACAPTPRPILPEEDAGSTIDAGVIADAGIVGDAGIIEDGGVDAGPITEDAGTDAGMMSDGGVDAGPPAPPSIQICFLDVSGHVTADPCFPEALSTLRFPDDELGVSEERQLRVTNIGGSILTISGAATVNTRSFTLEDGPVSATLGPGESLDLTVIFRPAANDGSRPTLLIPSDDPRQPMAAIPLYGTGPVTGGLCLLPADADFGGVEVGRSRTLPVTFSSCDTREVTVTQVTVNAGAFTLGALPTLPLTLRFGESFSVDVTYAPPTSMGTDARFVTASTATGGLDAWVHGHRALPTCLDALHTALIQVLSGGQSVNPEMPTFDLQRTITLDGSSSSTDGETPSYDWYLASAPAGSHAALSGATGATTTLSLDVAGSYDVQLNVSGTACRSAPAHVTLIAADAAPTIQVRLTWPESFGDIDLHYLGPDGELFRGGPSARSDMYWTASLATFHRQGILLPSGNTLTDFWGLNGTCAPDGTTDNDVSFDVDSRQGNSPEIVTHRHPFDATYTVVVHAWCTSGGPSASPIVDVLVNGAVAWHGQQMNMTSRQAWDAAQITVADGGQTVTVTPLATPVYATQKGCF